MEARALAQFVHRRGAGEPSHSRTAIVVNEYNGVAPTKFLNNSGTDTFWGRILGNGGDWFELVVVQDHLDLRGWKAIVSDNAGALVTTLTFQQRIDPVRSEERHDHHDLGGPTERHQLQRRSAEIGGSICARGPRETGSTSAI